MKKLSITLLALALALVMAAPAMAIHVGDVEAADGALGITGRYQFDGEARDVDGTKDDFFDDDLDLSFVFEKGDVKASVALEIADTNPFEGDGNKSPVDGYYIEWKAMDNLKVKIGEYTCAFGRAISTDGACDRNIKLSYSMDALSVAGILSKQDDGGEDERDEMVLMLDVNEAGPFTTLALASYNITDDLGGNEISYTGIDLGLPIGPVALGFEYGANGGDFDGNFMIVEIGLEELIGFDVSINYFASSDDYLDIYEGNDFAPMMIFGDNVNEELLDVTYIAVNAGYDVNDKLSVWAAALVSAEDDAGDAYGSEFDLGLKYALADNVTYKASYGTYSEGDDPANSSSGSDLDTTEMFHRLEFKW